MPTMKTSVVSLNRPMKVLTMPGMTMQRLRQHDQAHHLPVAEAERHRALVLALGDRLQAAAHDFRHVGRGEQRDADQRAQQLVRRPAGRHEQRQHHARHEQHGDQRHAAHELDEDHREQPHRRHLRAPPERQQDAERQRDTMPTQATTMVTSMPPHSGRAAGCRTRPARPRRSRSRRARGAARSARAARPCRQPAARRTVDPPALPGSDTSRK
jgi:hypothetical protein